MAQRSSYLKQLFIINHMSFPFYLHLNIKYDKFFINEKKFTKKPSFLYYFNLKKFYDYTSYMVKCMCKKINMRGYQEARRLMR